MVVPPDFSPKYYSLKKMAESTPVSVDNVEVPLDVTVSKPATFIGFAETKKPADCVSVHLIYKSISLVSL